MPNTIVMYQPNISKDFGLVRAIILQQIHFGAEVTGIFVGDSKWKATNIRKLCDETGLGSMTSMRRWVKSLIGAKVLAKSNQNCFNELYRINYPAIVVREASTSNFILEGQDYIPIKVALIKTLGVVRAAILAALDTDLKYHGSTIEGLKYVFKTAKTLATKTHIGAMRSMRRNLLELIKLGYLKPKYGLNQMASDRTKWYAKVETYRGLNPQKRKYTRIEVRPSWPQGSVQFGRLPPSNLAASNRKYIQESIIQESLSSPSGSYRLSTDKDLVEKTVGVKVYTSIIEYLNVKSKFKLKSNPIYHPMLFSKPPHLTRCTGVVLCDSITLEGDILSSESLLKTSGKKTRKLKPTTVSALLSDGLLTVAPRVLSITPKSVSSFFKFFDNAVLGCLGTLPTNVRTAKDFGMAKNLLRSFSEDTKALEYVLDNWLRFVDYLYGNNLAKEAPRIPVLGFLLIKVAYVLPCYENSLELLHTFAETLPPTPAQNLESKPLVVKEEVSNVTPEGWVIVDRPKDLPQESVHLYLNYIMAASAEDKALWLERLHEVGYHVYG